jgi:hypothetical protein
MIEILPFKVDVNQIRNELRKIKFLSITWQAKEYGYNNFGGWSVLSRKGTCQDGWEVGVEQCEGKNFNYKLAKFLDISHPFEHINKTPACIGEINKIIDLLEANGFYPRRARITVLKSGTKSITHSDAPPETYMCRIHIPIITNEKCIHWTIDDGDNHMPANGSVYMLPVNTVHQIINDSHEDRYHLIMDAYDTQHFTKTMRYHNDIKFIEQEAKLFRENMDKANLTIFHKLLYTIGRKFYKWLT